MNSWLGVAACHPALKSARWNRSDLPRNQFTHGLPAIDEILGAAGEVGQGDAIGVEAQLMVERGEDFAEVDAAIHDFSAESISRADDLTGFHSATGEKGAANLRPVVASSVLVDLRRATELAQATTATSLSNPRSCRSSTSALMA